MPTLPSEDWLDALIAVMLQPRFSYDELVHISDRLRKGYGSSIGCLFLFFCLGCRTAGFNVCHLRHVWNALACGFCRPSPQGIRIITEDNSRPLSLSSRPSCHSSSAPLPQVRAFRTRGRPLFSQLLTLPVNSSFFPSLREKLSEIEASFFSAQSGKDDDAGPPTTGPLAIPFSIRTMLNLSSEGVILLDKQSNIMVRATRI